MNDAGARVQAIVPFAPKAGAALNVALMSYDGSVFLGLNIDTGSVRDPRVMVECFEEALAEVIAVGRTDTAPSAKKPGTRRSATKPAKKSAAKKSAAKK